MHWYCTSLKTPLTFRALIPVMKVNCILTCPAHAHVFSLCLNVLHWKVRRELKVRADCCHNKHGCNLKFSFFAIRNPGWPQKMVSKNIHGTIVCTSRITKITNYIRLQKARLEKCIFRVHGTTSCWLYHHFWPPAPSVVLAALMWIQLLVSSLTCSAVTLHWVQTHHLFPWVCSYDFLTVKAKHSAHVLTL